MVRLSLVLGSVRYAKRQKYIREKKSVYKVIETSKVKAILKRREVEVVNPVTYIHPPETEWEPPSTLPDDFRLERFKENTEEKSKGNFPVWHLSSRTNFTSDIDQACLLTKTQKIGGLPEPVKELMGKYSIDNQDERVKDVIMYSQVWNNTKEKLPKHIDLGNQRHKFKREYGIPDTKSGHILLDSFVRLCQSMSGKFPELATDRRMFCKAPVEATFDFAGETLEITADHELLLTGRRALTPPASEKMIRKSEHYQIPDMYPILPTVDFEKVYKEERSVIRHKGAFKKDGLSCSYPQMLFRVNGGQRRKSAFQAYNIMTTFGVAVAEAKNRYGIVDGPLDTPLTIININNSHSKVNFLVFQLNTLDFKSSDGVKNFVWYDSGTLFTKTYCQPWLEPDGLYKPPTYSDYNPEVFKKFLALYLYDYVKLK